MHPLLQRQLKRLGLAVDQPPDAAGWAALLDRVATTYAEADQDRYTLERSLNISSSEMQELYDDLKRSSQTELAIQRDKLQISVATLHATQEASADGILLIDQHRELVDFNTRFFEIWAIDEATARRSTSAELRELAISRVAQPEQFRALIEALHAGRVETSHDELALSDGRQIECVSKLVVMPTGSAHGRVYFFRDVTQDRRAAQLLHEAKDAAELASRAKLSFLSNMSHEMRTPLNSILGFAQVMQTRRFGPLNDKQGEYLEYILRAGRHMLALVNDLLDLRRIQEDRLELPVTRLELGPVIEEALELVKALADQKQHAVRWSVEPQLPDALAERRTVVQILVNLLSNAVKFTPPGGRIEVTARTSPEASPGAILVAVADTGIGIPPEHHDKLFTYFEQLGAKHALELKGSGIGLALTRAMVEKLGGRIVVRSAPGAGTTFEFSIPRWNESP